MGLPAPATADSAGMGRVTLSLLVGWPPLSGSCLVREQPGQRIGSGAQHRSAWIPSLLMGVGSERTSVLLMRQQHHEGEGDPRSLALRRANSVQFATALKVDLGTKRPASREYPHPHKHDVLLMCHG